jgi:TrpR family transcriptional regulator, trp operon repressor
MIARSKKEEYYREIIEILQKIAGDPAMLDAFLDDLLTPAEKEEIGQRLQIVKQLHSGKTQREVAGDLGVSIATVTRGAGVLKNKKGGFNELLKQAK